MRDDDPAVALLAACTGEPETDIGNGRRLRHRFGDLAVKYEGSASFIAINVANIAWHVYDGRRWKEDEDDSLIRQLAHRAAEAIRKEAFAIDATEEEAAAIQAGEVAAGALDRLPDPRKGFPDDNKHDRAAYEEAMKQAERAVRAIASRRAARFRWAETSASSGKLNNMLQEASPYVSRKVHDLNPERLFVNCLSGTIEFREVDEEDEENPDPDSVRIVRRWRAFQREHRQADLITKMIAVPFDPEAQGDPLDQAPEFRKFLHKVQQSPEVRLFLKRWCGYCLTGLTVEQVMLFFYGIGRNGKTTFLDILGYIFDDYAVTLSIDSFSGEQKRGGAEATPDLARLPGARVVIASEPEAGAKLRDALIKTLTGGEKIPVRRLHKDFFEVDPHFKIILSGNHKLRIDDDSDGIWRRVVMVPWEIQIPRAEVDRRLPEKLKAEAPAILRWMVEGAVEYLNEGLAIPESIRAASQEYREEQDPIGAFIRVACQVNGENASEERPQALFHAFERFADAEGVFKYNRATFERRFAAAARRSWDSGNGEMRQFVRAKSGTTLYRGIRIREEWRQQASEPPPP